MSRAVTPLRFLLLPFLFLGLPAFADPLHGSLELGTSVSNAYEARSLFSNPAALGYQTELNGPNLLTAFTFGVNQGYDNEFSKAISYGYFGVGMEKLTSVAGKSNRFSFGLGVPFRHPFYFGARYVLNRPDTALLERFDSVDLGLQYRPSRFFSVGVMANGVNRPSLQYIAGVVARPLDRLELGIDVDTPSVDLGKQWGYQTTASYEIARGLRLRGGYHKEYQWQAGLAWNFGIASLHSTFQPSSDSRRFTAGFQVAPLPYRSTFEPETALKIEIDDSLDERPVRGSLFASARPSLIDLLEKLREAEKHVPKLLLLHIESFPLGPASAQELFHALSRVRERGTRIEAFLSSAGTKEYLIASVANQIHIEPGGELRLWGLRAERYFIKGTLGKAGVEGEFYARGEYKSAPEMFTRKDSAPLTRETILEELKHAEELLVPLLGKYREMSRERWKQTITTAIFGAQSAKRAGLVDDIQSYKMALDKFEDNFQVRESLDEMQDSLSLPERVAVVIADGDILDRKFSILGLGGRDVVTPEGIERHLKRAVSDPRTKAIVLRVNSPGGEVLASQRIASLIEKTRQDKPVVISMGDVAASGGYMIAAPGNRIFASPMTLTGSIGVFLGKFSVGDLYKKIDLHKEILSHSPHSGFLTEHRPWTAEERAIMIRRLNEYYDEFVGFVGKWRGMAPPDAEKAAKGRVWTGDKAKLLGLVDENGGYREAIAYALDKAGVSPEHYEVWTITSSPGLLAGLSPLSLLGRSEEDSTELVSSRIVRDLSWMLRVSENPFLYLAPVAAIE